MTIKIKSYNQIKIENYKDINSNYYKYLKVMLYPNIKISKARKNKTKVDEEYFISKLEYPHHIINRIITNKNKPKEETIGKNKTSEYLSPLINNDIIEKKKQLVYIGKKKRSQDFLTIKEDAFEILFLKFYSEGNIDYFKNSLYYNKYHKELLKKIQKDIGIMLDLSDNLDIVYYYLINKNGLKGIIKTIEKSFKNNDMIHTEHLNFNKEDIITLLSLSIKLNKNMEELFIKKEKTKIDASIIFNLFNLLNRDRKNKQNKEDCLKK